MSSKSWAYLGALELLYVALVGGEMKWFPSLASVILTLPMVVLIGWDNWRGTP